MKKILNSKVYKVLFIAVLVYAIYIFYTQQIKLNNYNKEKQYYNDQIADLNAQKEELIVEKENVNSPEHIEDIAREKLDMYLPNEKVFVDINK